MLVVHGRVGHTCVRDITMRGCIPCTSQMHGIHVMGPARAPPGMLNVVLTLHILSDTQMSEQKWLRRFLFLETVAGVPGTDGDRA